MDGSPASSDVVDTAEEPVWLHFMFSTYGTWIRADRRGFRDAGHRIHSSGNYKRRPPASEHANLRNWVLEHMHSDPIELAKPDRARLGGLLLASLRRSGAEVVVLAAAKDHVHGLAKLPLARARAIIGTAKRMASRGVRDTMPGQVWAKRCALRRIRDRGHQRRTFAYIVAHAKQGAWVWTFRDAINETPARR